MGLPAKRISYPLNIRTYNYVHGNHNCHHTKEGLASLVRPNRHSNFGRRSREMILKLTSLLVEWGAIFAVRLARLLYMCLS